MSGEQGSDHFRRPGEETLRAILDKALQGPVKAVPFLEEWPGHLFEACILRLREAEARAEDGQSAMSPGEFYHLTETLVAYGDRRGIPVPELWHFLCESTENPLDVAPEQRRADWRADLSKSLQKADMCVTRLDIDSRLRASPDETGRLTELEKELVDEIRHAGRRMTTTEILRALSSKGKIPSVGTTENYLASLGRRGLLTNRQDVDPPGYGLPEWG